MSLQDIEIKNEYRSLIDNVAKDFYIPLLKEYFVSSDEIEIKNVMTNYLKIEAWPIDTSFNQTSFNKLIDIIKEAGELPKNVEVPYEKIVQNI